MAHGISSAEQNGVGDGLFEFCVTDSFEVIERVCPERKPSQRNDKNKDKSKRKRAQKKKKSCLRRPRRA